MGNHDAFGTRLGGYFGLKDVPSYTSRRGKASVDVARLRSDRPRLGLTDIIPAEDAYFIAVSARKPFTSVIRKPTTSPIWFDDQLIPPQPFGKNSVYFVHLERDARVNVQNPFDMIHFCIPRISLSQIARDLGARGIDALRCPPLVTIDPVLTQLTGCLAPYLAGTGDIYAPFVDHVLLALQAHLAQKYGELKIPLRSGKESLAPWQVHRAKELMASRISGSITLSELASECQLSVFHFVRAFKRSVGVAPHRWLMVQKMERAKQLLESTSLTINAIALQCGFSNRVPFSNAFRRAIGFNPGEWRRARQTSQRMVCS